MGGEKYAGLFYGPKMSITLEQWLLKLEIIDKKGFAEKFVKESGDDDYILDEEGIDIIFMENICDYAQYYYTELLAYLEKYNMTTYYSNTTCWEYICIGLLVNDYHTISDSGRVKVNDFCDRYNLGKPSYFGGIFGDYE